MKLALLRLSAAVLCAGLLLCIPASAVPAAPHADAPHPAKSGASPEKVLDAMDQQAQTFTSVQAEVVWDQYESAVEETTTQAGTMWVLKRNKNLEMAVDLWTKQPGGKNSVEKYVVFTGGKVQVFEPKINQVTEYDTGKKRQAFESLLVLGFGGGGHSLLEQFTVRHTGREALKGVGTDRETQEGAETDKLELVPKTNAVGRLFERIELWIDANGLCLQQKFYETATGNYRLVRYSHIKPNAKFRDDVFKLKTNNSTQIVRQ